MLVHGDLIIVGDMNFTTNSKAFWGVTALVDPLAAFLKVFFFVFNQLVDISPTKVVPTWRNGRTGVDEIVKRLDMIYVTKDRISSSVRYRSWVDYPYISDHAPVLL
jgi:endonuclease/exonuclease/phosphatase family metal-dependent hydrolase